jgi:hypothetical protein
MTEYDMEIIGKIKWAASFESSNQNILKVINEDRQHTLAAAHRVVCNDHCGEATFGPVDGKKFCMANDDMKPATFDTCPLIAEIRKETGGDEG